MQAATPSQHARDREPFAGREPAGVRPRRGGLALRPRHPGGPAVVETTLLELVRAVAEESDDEREAVATVIHMLQRRRVRLTGTFREHEDDVSAA